MLYALGAVACRGIQYWDILWISFFIFVYFPRFDPQTGLLTGTNDGTVVNVYLRIFGRKSEKSLCIHLLLVQVIHSHVQDVLFNLFSLSLPLSLCLSLSLHHQLFKLSSIVSYVYTFFFLLSFVVGCWSIVIRNYLFFYHFLFYLFFFFKFNSLHILTFFSNTMLVTFFWIVHFFQIYLHIYIIKIKKNYIFFSILQCQF